MRRMLFIIVVSLAALLLNVPSQAQLGQGEISGTDNFIQAQKVFTSSGMTIQDIKLQAWGQINKGNYSLEEMSDKYTVLAASLGLDQKKKAVQVEKDGFISISHLEVIGDETWQLSLQSLPLEPDCGETYLGLLYSCDDPVKAQMRHASLRPLLREAGLSQDLAVVFTGLTGGFLDLDRQWAMALELARVIGGDFIEGIADKDLTSLSFYSGDQRGFIEVNGRRINLNIALKYKSQEKNTYLYVGVPLINCDY